jgi:hypothetical protein
MEHIVATVGVEVIAGTHCCNSGVIVGTHSYNSGD